MKYDGQAIQCSVLEGGIVELKFDLRNDSVNKFNAETLRELREAVTALKADKSLKGVLLTSGKEVFIVGADVMEFLDHFKKSEAELATWLKDVDQTFSDLEDLDCPVVAAINGIALGGGFEVALAASYRVASSAAKVGLPEVKLGIFPGWGGTVRLSRICGADSAIEWICGGEQWSAEAALKIGAVDAVVAPDKVRDMALDLLKRAVAGEMDWKARREEKLSPLRLNPVEAGMVFEGSKAFVAAAAGPNYPAPIAAIEVMQKGAGKKRDEALAIEAETFARIAKTPVAHSLVSLFLADQYLKKVNKKLSKNGDPVKMAAVLGAGIMGGGVAYQSASKGTPILMKDIAPKALEIGLTEATKLLDKQVEKKKITSLQMASTLNKISATLSYGDFKAVDLVVEAVVENEKIKKSVITEVEAACKPGAVIASNTSTISITRLAEAMKNPENFCGMHFFNPVHRMPLVEVIRGAKSSEKAVATTVNYALAMGKTPIVVNDCPGFLVNRVLFPYFSGFLALVHDGVDFQRVDKVMEKFGWPMGPAYLLDVVGIDTGHHANAVMAEGFPDRMKQTYKTAMDVMYENRRYGQKNEKGFYKYTIDKRGKPKKEADPDVAALLKPVITGNLNATITDQEIIDRMMLPMIIECSRCLEDKIVPTPAEVDMGLIFGLGFPPFRGGAMRYTDAFAGGLRGFCDTAAKYSSLGKLYEPTAQMKQMAAAGKTFY
ncbi:MAG: multifunctional fatty acid oxidation complex subunit alpha [Bdellovibrionales bacterium GWC1_52_8]|nr:MAG: multifunctional fatty acid oxidation complex subunit alpha [Bdellovibrionales bacterium GWB1_52_6]OFZ03757.1 MAG: multifunctional fatty acid oxidation complex subunit alpha [Bdellovibrionales bacterium GWA1_52_35]OFZ41778.1 MAG: multifunctional fatty acid oxidation complex subunit alpha [Bdellovibrionales bacterium GWC1_52_8]HCM38726.1 fatty acid oxidation complex subunit alpha FadB [Bdellovibrionales bacterium]